MIRKLNTRRGINIWKMQRGVMPLLFLASGWSAAAANIHWQENFTLVSNGAAPSDWTITAEPKTACAVVGMPGSLEKVLKFNTLIAAASVSAEKRFAPCRGVISMEWRFFESEAGKGQAFVIGKGSENAVVQLFVDSAGKLCLNDSSRVVHPRIITNQWYKVKVLLRTDVKRCDLYLNDVPITSEVPFITSADGITGFRVLCDTADPGILHVTDISVSSVKSLPGRKVQIHPDRERQGIDGVGFCHEGNRALKKPYVIDELIQGMLDNKMSLFRDRFPGKIWEPANDDGDPFTIDMKGFAAADSGVLSVLLRLKEMQDRGITTILGIWDVADWMVSNPKAGNARKINNMDEFAETVCAFLRYGREKYGLTVNFVDVNETEMVGINLRLTASEYGSFVKKSSALFQRNGLSTKVNIGSTLKWGVTYVAEMFADSAIRACGGYPSFHSYFGTGTEPNDNSTFLEWGRLQQTLDRNLWCTETDYDAYYWENPERLTFRGVAEMAYNYWRIFYLARASTAAGWFWRTDYPSHNVHRAYMNFFEPGGKIVDASQDYPGIFTVAYMHPDKKKFVLQVLNASGRGGPVVFSGVPNRPLTLVRTSADGDRFATVGTFAPADHRVSVDIGGESFNTIYGELE